MIFGGEYPDKIQEVVLSRGQRLRKRGPRSKLAILRRSVPKHRRALPGMSPGESGDLVPVSHVSNTSHRLDNINTYDCTPEYNARNSRDEGFLILSVNI